MKTCIIRFGDRISQRGVYTRDSFKELPARLPVFIGSDTDVRSIRGEVTDLEIRDDGLYGIVKLINISLTGAGIMQEDRTISCVALHGVAILP